MAGPENMADGAQTETLVIANKSGVVITPERGMTERPPEFKGSTFQRIVQTQEWHETQARERVTPLTPQEQADMLARSNEINRLVGEARDNGILTFAADDISGVYTEVTTPTPAQNTSFDYEDSPAPGSGSNLKPINSRVKYARGVLAADYQETFWGYGPTTLKAVFRRAEQAIRQQVAQLNLPPDQAEQEINNRMRGAIEDLRRDYEGVASYVASRAAIAIEKDLTGKALTPTEDWGDATLTEIKTGLVERNLDRERRRREQRKRATADERLHYNTWRERFNFTWAETPAELTDSVFDWLEKFRQELPDEAPVKVDEAVREGRRNALSALKEAENRLGIPLGSPTDKELRATIEAYVDAIGGVRLLESEGGFEAYTGYLEDFAYNFNAHNDAIILGNAKSVILQDFLAENDGAIALGAPGDIEKPLEGDILDFRGNIEWQAKIYAANHELYIRKADFESVQLGETEIRNEVSQLNLPADQAEQVIKERLEERRRDRELGEAVIRREVTQLNLPRDQAEQIIEERVAEIRKNRRYDWGDADPIEELLLTDSRGMTRARALTDPAARAEAIAKVQARTGVFRSIKERLDKGDSYRNGSLADLNDDQRKEAIRTRIRQKIEQSIQREEGRRVLLQEVDALPDQVTKDQALWNWVKEFNELRAKYGAEPWFPSFWDQVRLSIDRPTKLVDRALLKKAPALDENGNPQDDVNGRPKTINALKAMIEEVEDPYKDLTEKQIRAQINREFSEAIRQQVAQLNLPPDQVDQEINNRMRGARAGIEGRVDDVLFDQEQRMSESVQAFNINMTYMKFLGLQARWGGQVVRVLDDEGNMVLKTMSSMARDILKAKIDKEEADIETRVNRFVNDMQTRNIVLTPERLEAAKLRYRRLLRKDATFGATLGLREIGIANDLPIWNYYYYNDPQRIQAFAPLVGLTHERKPEIVELLDLGRREMKAVFDYLAAAYMDGRILTVVDDELTGQHEEHKDRSRVINQGGELALRDVFDCRTMLSTSGAIEMVDLISKVADLGIYDLLWEMGAWDFQDFQGFLKRRDEVELRKQSFWNTTKWRDPITYAQRLRGAKAAIPFLKSGEVKGQGSVVGVLIEPIRGAFRMMDEFVNAQNWIPTEMSAKTNTINDNYAITMQQELEKLSSFQKLDPVAQHNIGNLTIDVISYLANYMEALRYKMNRAGLAPKNWKADNELIFTAWADELLKRTPLLDELGKLLQDEILGGAEKLGPQDLGYNIQGRSRLAIEFYKRTFMETYYYTLVEKDRNAWRKRGKEVQAKVATKRAEIAAQALPAAIQRRINLRLAKLRAKNTSQTNLNWEEARLKEQYIDEELHKQFVGEWPASFAEIY